MVHVICILGCNMTCVGCILESSMAYVVCIYPDWHVD